MSRERILERLTGAGGRGMVVAVWLVLTVSVGCSIRRAPVYRLRVDVEGRANGDRPVAFDLVAVRGKALGAEISKLTAAQWFEKREQIRSDFPGRQELDIHSWEWVPGQLVGEVAVKVAMRPRDTFVFANYGGGGENRARLASGRPARIVLGEKKMSVSEGGGHLAIPKK